MVAAIVTVAVAKRDKAVITATRGRAAGVTPNAERSADEARSPTATSLTGLRVDTTAHVYARSYAISSAWSQAPESSKTLIVVDGTTWPMSWHNTKSDTRRERSAPA